MLRRLLACLALLTGLAATGTAARAEAITTALQVEASVTAIRGQATQPASVSARSRPAFDRADTQPVPFIADVPYAAPSVRLLSDRARE